MLDILVPLAIVIVMAGFAFLFVTGLVYLSLNWFYARMKKCPKCGRKDAAVFKETKFVDANIRVDWKDERQEEGDRVTEWQYKDHFECKYCGHQWSYSGRKTERQPIG
jgi:hypothetical protein